MSKVPARLNLIIAIAVVIAAISFVVAYGLDAKRASDKSTGQLYIEAAFFIGAIFFFIYAALSLYEAIKYPRQYQVPY